MPTYDYKCNGCGHTFELFQSMSAATKRKCPECGKNTLERLIGTGAAVLFKGSGFYETDYRSKSYQEAAKSEKEAASAKPDKAADSKPAADTKADKSKADAPAKTEKAKPAKPASGSSKAGGAAKSSA
ncbi:MAG: FmdB family zinc ribbon protein [Phycisphaerales bacterium JB054]